MKNVISDEVSKYPLRTTALWLVCVIVHPSVRKDGYDKADGAALGMIVFLGTVIVQFWWRKIRARRWPTEVLFACL